MTLCVKQLPEGTVLQLLDCFNLLLVFLTLHVEPHISGCSEFHHTDLTETFSLPRRAFIPEQRE